MSEVNYKQKYMELRLKFMNALDVAFRQGYEQGSQDAQMQAQQEQQMQAQQMQQAAMGGGAPGQPGEDPNAQPGQPGEPAPDSMNPQGSELDQHIAKLESMLGKSEVDQEALKKTLADLKFSVEMKKSEKAIGKIAKALNPTLKLSPQASHNMNDKSKGAVTLQQKIVTDVMKSWAKEETKAASDINNILNIEGITDRE